jgi:hypothetical protein
MITAKGDGSFDDFLLWANQAGHFSVVVLASHYAKYCEHIKEMKGELSEKQRYVEE